MPAALFPQLEAVDYAFDGTLTVPKGCLMYHDTNDAKPAASQADAGTEVLNQRTFANLFAGVADEQKNLTDTASGQTIAVCPIWVGEISCSSSTFEVGDLVGPVEQSNGTQLENLKVAKVTDPDLAIGYVIKRVASAATTVRVVLMSRTTPAGRALGGVRIGKLVSQSLARADFTDGGSTSGTLAFTGTLPAGALVLGWEANVTTPFIGDTSAVISVGVSGTAGKFSADTAQSCFTTGRRGSAPVVATAFQATAVSPLVTVTSAADFTNVSAGAMTVTIFYIAMLP